MRLLLLVLPLVAACSPPGTDTAARDSGTKFETVGRLQDPRIDEASGLTRSQRSDQLLWVINDDGKPELHAIDTRGGKLGRVEVRKAKLSDWEDVASFTLDDEHFLLVADVGDNNHRRKDVTLYVIGEPDEDENKTKADWRIDFSYPDGPRDAEAVAVDIDNERVLVLSKRDIPAVLYAVPLLPESDERQIATRLGTVATLPQPSRRDVEVAPRTDNWFWQPTGMDISPDGRFLTVLTYGGVYLYRRTAGEDWIDALQRPPLVLGTTRNREAESIAFSADGTAIFITMEGINAPLVRATLPVPQRHEPAAVSIMTFNVENLFDNLDDPGKDDKAYLPLTAKHSESHIAACNEIEVERWRDSCLTLDWNDATIGHKLGVTAATIRQVDNGRGPDIIALQEIENLAILERLRTEYLADGDYLPAILIEGNDNRGIDVAFLSRLPLVGEPTLHALEFPEFPERAGDTRGVLEATFELPDGSLLTGFSVHFPAPFHPTAMRVAAYEHLNAIRADVPAEHNVFAAGDFNTTSGEDAREGMLERFVRPLWIVAHELCERCPGTHYYARDGVWSFLDMILFSPARSENTTWEIRADSVRIANGFAAQTRTDGTPNRFNAAELAGVSDHWPVVVILESAKKQ